MEQSIFHRLSNVLWGFAVTLIVLLAIYVSVGRLLSTNLQTYQDEVLHQLNSRVPFSIEAESLRGEWRSFTPSIVLSGLRLSLPGAGSDALELSGGRIGLDVLDSLLTRSLQFTTLELSDLSLKGELTADGRLRIAGLGGSGGPLGEWLEEFLLNVEHLTLQGNTLELTVPGGEHREFRLDLGLTREGSSRRVDAQLISTRGTRIQVIGEGVGNPFRPEQFSGNLYLDLDSGDLWAVRDMLANGPPPVWAEGALELEFWLSWNKGRPVIETSIQARDVVITDRDDSWELPLARLALEASLVERRNRWTLFAENVQFEQGEARVQLPRMQFDAWGESLRVRAADVPLEPVNQFLLTLEQVPASLAKVFGVLNPTGTMTSLQLNVGDMAAPMRDWSAEASFDGVGVQSWSGAPGVTSASGYLELDQDGGYVVLDSQQFTMDFPTVYREPLYYDDFHGTLGLEWDSEALVLSSGIITARAVEGTARALFRLNIPLVPSEVGLEMDLLVGLQDSHPIHRVKYIPYILNPTLREWLAGSVGEGVVRDAGFIWRGSLRRGASRMRTVQLALNVEDTALDYHPDWPPVADIDGLVLIDDTRVSVWAQSARLYDSTLQRLSAETWLNDAGEMMLAIDAQMRGPAADGLSVVNNSLLGKLTGQAFNSWSASGELDTRLGLTLNLGDKQAPPMVSVATDWQNVDLLIQPGNLAVEELRGALYYQGDKGFSSEGLKGSFWGEALTAEVSQLPAADSDSLSLGESTVSVALATSADMADVREWLGLHSLAFANGAAPVSAEIRVPPGERPVLEVRSQLQGVALDLPTPWTKAVDEQLALQLALPLGGDTQSLDLGLGDDLAMRLDLTGGSLQGASLSFNAQPLVIETNRLRINGRAPLVEVEQWMQFVSHYYAGGLAIGDSGAGTVESSGGEATPLVVSIEELQAARVLLWNREFADVRFSLLYEPGGWDLEAQNAWLAGDLSLPADGGPGRLHLQRFNLAGLEPLAAPVQQEVSQSGAEPLDLPRLEVTVDSLYSGDRQLGNLAFNLHTQDSTLYASEITGSVAGLELGAGRPAALSWLQDSGGRTSLEASLYFADFGDTLGQLGYEKFIETEQGRLDLALQWPGGPQDFALVTGQGSVLIDVERGRFLETPAGATGALRVVGILNLADMLQRLSLSHMFESGIPFHTMDGEVYLHGGTLEVASMEVAGASSSFAFSGLSDVASRSLDGELVATLPVANNLPWVAALAGGLPVAAGVFVVSKVFEKQMNRLSSGVYSIGGTWDEPEVEFDRIFDDAVRVEPRASPDPNQPVASEAPPKVPVDPNQPPSP